MAAASNAKANVKELPPKWKIREQLVLASAVQRSGDQNWVSVSRCMKPLADESRAPDFYSQKSCATQYSMLLDKTSIPRRKRKEDGSQESVETVEEQIVRLLTGKRIKELDKTLAKMKEEYMSMKKEMEMIERGELDSKLVYLLEESDTVTPLLEEACKKGIVPPSTTSNPTLSVSAPLITSIPAPKIPTTPVPAPTIPTTPVPAPTIPTTPVPAPTIPVPSPSQPTAIDPNSSVPAPSTPTHINPAPSNTIPVDPAPPSPIPVDLAPQNPIPVDPAPQNPIPVDPTPQNTIPVDPAPSVLTSKSNQKTETQSIPDTAPSSSQTTPPSNESVAPQSPNTTHDTQSHDTNEIEEEIDVQEMEVDPPVTMATKGTKKEPIDEEKKSKTTTGRDGSLIVKGDLDVKRSVRIVGSARVGGSEQEKKLLEVAEIKTDQSVDGALDNAPPTEDQSDIVMDTVPVANTVKREGLEDTDNTPAVPLDDVKEPCTSGATPTEDQQQGSGSESKGEEGTEGEKPSTVRKKGRKRKQKGRKGVVKVGVVEESDSEEEYRHESEEEEEYEGASPKPLPRRTSGRRSLRKRDKSCDSHESPLLKSAKSSERGRKKSGLLEEEIVAPPTGRRGRTLTTPTGRRRGRTRIKAEFRDSPKLEEESEEDRMSSAIPSPATSQGDNESETPQALRTWRKTIMLVWRHASQHKYANLFLHPVKEEDAPGYHEVILRPMDLSTIKKNIETGVIHCDVEFQRDMMLMFQNALMYNSSDHDVYKMAEEMRNDVVENIQEYLTTQLMVQTSTAKALRSRDLIAGTSATPTNTPPTSISGRGKGEGEVDKSKKVSAALEDTPVAKKGRVKSRPSDD